LATLTLFHGWIVDVRKLPSSRFNSLRLNGSKHFRNMELYLKSTATNYNINAPKIQKYKL
jgi:hypothetical protein